MDRANRMCVLLPSVWGCGCALGFANPGDEYGLFALGSIIGVWTIAITGQLVLAPTLIVGCIVMFGFGLLLDSLRVSRRLWVTVWLVSGMALYMVSIRMFPSVEHAVSKNGSLVAYLAAASQVGVYLSTLAMLVVAVVKTRRPPNRAATTR